MHFDIPLTLPKVVILMGNSSRPGSIVIREIDHTPFEVFGEQHVVRELIWNGIAARSFDLVRLTDGAVLTDESFGEYPTDAQIAETLRDHGVDVELSVCMFCGEEVLPATAHRRRNGWVGNSCCRDDRLRATE
ncbi:hypothetical protein [Saccharothrix sp. NRRL B-16348]|uniref:hypothetical protein n=1 Tax=Saccharothrix sp. NRRL B-16348 TaxID=1415542 RepID=UPI0012FCE5B5|nr:hypothetical protein [Saccharothrix sp. NRRL B-16348]